MINSIKIKLVQSVKKLVFPHGEKYEFKGKNITFKTNAAPVKRKYIDNNSDVVRNDVLQILYLEKNFQPHHVLWDIGSHYGHYAVLAASAVKGPRQIFSFEPDEVARKTQEETIKLNHFENKIEIFDLVVSEHVGRLKFIELNGNANSHIVKDANLEDKNINYKESKNLDTLLEELEVPDFVKIDTEGAEIDILKGASKLLSNPKVKFICELHPFAWDDFHVSFQELLDLLSRHNRTIELLDSKKSMNQLPYYGTILF